jgi:phage RecT family recombinase
MGTDLTLPNSKKTAAQFNARRADDSLRFAVEKQHLMAHAANNPRLLECQPESVANVMLQSAGMGLSLNPSLAHAYPIPYRDNSTGITEAHLLIGYRGLLHTVQKASTVKDIHPGLVYEKDPVFQVWTDETGCRFRHEQSRGDRGKVTHAYVLARFTNGGHHVEVMTAAQLEACEAAARKRNAKGGAVWRGPFRDQMMIKAVIRRAWKLWPKDDGGVIEQAMQQLDEVEPLEFSSEPEVCITDEQATELHALCSDYGMDSKLADRWLAKLAQRYGLSEIEGLPASKFENVKRDLSAYLKQWNANNQGGK